MRRLIPVLIAVLSVSTLPVSGKNCCDRSTASQCHHRKTPKDRVPCDQTLAVCAYASCRMEQQSAVTPAVQSNRFERAVSELGSTRFRIVALVWTNRARELDISPAFHHRGKAFLRNHAFLI